MCHRFVPLSLSEAEEALYNLQHTGSPDISEKDSADGETVADAYPGSNVPILVPDKIGSAASSAPEISTLKAEIFTWGFTGTRNPEQGEDVDGVEEHELNKIGRGGKFVFNTRLNSAVLQMNTGKGMWSDAIKHGRCLIPVRAFYELHETEPAADSGTGKPLHQPYRFTIPGCNVYLLAGIAENDRFSIVTTDPNQWVAPVHDRMPLALGKGEAAKWLAGDFDVLADRNSLELIATPES